MVRRSSEAHQRYVHTHCTGSSNPKSIVHPEWLRALAVIHLSDACTLNFDLTETICISLYLCVYSLHHRSSAHIWTKGLANKVGHSSPSYYQNPLPIYSTGAIQLARGIIYVPSYICVTRSQHDASCSQSVSITT